MSDLAVEKVFNPLKGAISLGKSQESFFVVLS